MNLIFCPFVNSSVQFSICYIFQTDSFQNYPGSYRFKYGQLTVSSCRSVWIVIAPIHLLLQQIYFQIDLNCFDRYQTARNCCSYIDRNYTVRADHTVQTDLVNFGLHLFIQNLHLFSSKLNLFRHITLPINTSIIPVVWISRNNLKVSLWCL